MADTEYRRIFDAARDRAFFGFLALVQRAIQDVGRNIAALEVKSNIDRAALASLRHFLHQDGNVFLRRIDAHFRRMLDRAMQTMYIDLRANMRKLTADELSLIDDDAVSHQIEVGRLTQRMRDACEESIGRLNVIIAHMHGEHEAKERENPFRPYLLARVLYDATRESVAGEAIVFIWEQPLEGGHWNATYTMHAFIGDIWIAGYGGDPAADYVPQITTAILAANPTLQ